MIITLMPNAGAIPFLKINPNAGAITRMPVATITRMPRTGGILRMPRTGGILRMPAVT